jgi:hypothetical protein
MLVSPDHSQGEVLDVAAGLAVLVDPAGLPLGTVQPGRVSVLVSPASKHLACPWIQPTQPTWHTAALGRWKTLHNCRICAAADLPNP